MPVTFSEILTQGTTHGKKHDIGEFPETAADIYDTADHRQYFPADVQHIGYYHCRPYHRSQCAGFGRGGRAYFYAAGDGHHGPVQRVKRPDGPVLRRQRSGHHAAQRGHEPADLRDCGTHPGCWYAYHNRPAAAADEPAGNFVPGYPQLYPHCGRRPLGHDGLQLFFGGAAGVRRQQDASILPGFRDHH